MADSWLHGVTEASLTLCIAGQALAAEGKVTIFAAASSTSAMQDTAQEYKKKKNVDVMSSFASSSTLARQIEAGIPADLFISAGRKWMDHAADKKAIDPAARAALLGSNLVAVAPKASAQGAIIIDGGADWTSLLRGGCLAVDNPQYVPADIYAKEALQKLGAWKTLSPELVPTKDVHSALALVGRNEVPLGIVYGSDAVTSKGVKAVGTFPETSHQKVKCPLAAVGGHRNTAVSTFYNYLKEPGASAIFKRYGLITR